MFARDRCLRHGKNASTNTIILLDPPEIDIPMFPSRPTVLSGIRNPVLIECCFSAILHYMKSTVTITSRGVITLPAKLRRALGLKADDHLIAETTPEGLLLRPAVMLPVEIYSTEREREFDAAEAELAAALASKASKRRRVVRAGRATVAARR